MSQRTDLTQYSDSELSLLVFNDEYLYRNRRNIRALGEIIDQLYIYTPEQWHELVDDLETDLNEDE